ncbi:LysR family transcriptional regulator [Consotaella aegiceratis]|uniref:LysR family transcriptional regulator n=1 Tax=Consotaella aegiceratis TaxID=3097961 RepID=UPI002F3E21B5
MNIKALRAFRAIVAEGSMSAAAQTLNLSQPAISRLISLLESELQLSLFKRDRRRLVLTEQGAAFEREASRILIHLDEIPRIAAEIRSSSVRRLRLVTMPRTALSIVSPAVARFSREHPDVEVSLDLRARRDLDFWIGGREYDFGFGNVPVGHRAAVGIPLVRTALQVLVTQFPGLLLRRQIDELFEAHDVRPRRLLLAGSSQIMQHLVANGAGVTVIDRLSTLALAPGVVSMRPFKPERWVAFGVIRPRANRLDPLSERMIDYLRDEIAKHLEAGSIELPTTGGS